MNAIGRYAKEHGLTLVDATTPLEIEVKRGDIRTAKTKHHKECAFAKACKRTFAIRNAYFFRAIAYLEFKDKMVRFSLPHVVQREIVSFDRNQDMEPGRYFLAAVSPSRNRDIQRSYDRLRHTRRRDNEGTTNIKRGLIHRTTNVRGAYQPGELGG